ncbi:hypothetical protein LY632_04795 [Erythrobacter sp. SDW2]|uniref:hypothetical protein n=1 Tax=Erythrobacter sp. SDW2 TaxID=2907154 RepID=UPI001F1B9FFB|nr:hypothetical protein [Erythrobacter sp. SDW2]UIP07720.1 hypothetical protein LY632_04795 [Erythrobacter sp. SDW2]
MLSGIPSAFEQELFRCYKEIERNFRERRWEPAELNGGKLCEASYSILKGHVDNSFPAKPSKPKNMLEACKALESAPSTFGRSIRLQIPRMLVALYEIRNNRNVGHIGGDVDPNHMDAVCVLQMSKWIVGEFIRLFHNVSVEEASNLVEALTERHIDVVWHTGSKKRILKPGLSMIQKALLMLYSEAEPMSEATLVDYIEHSNPSVFRRDVLRKAHREKLLEYDAVNKTVEISPLGIKLVEEGILI